MLNGMNQRSDTIKSSNATEVTSTEQFTDSYECQMFSLKDIYPEASNSSELPNSPSFKTFRLIENIPRSDDNSTIFTAFQSRKMTEEAKSSVGTSITEFRLATLSSPEGNKCIEGAMGSSPCAAYCGRCKTYVHTAIDYQEDTSANYFIKITQALTMCCGRPDWIYKLMVHRCPHCSIILGKL
jgi:hypothetical protein